MFSTFALSFLQLCYFPYYSHNVYLIMIIMLVSYSHNDYPYNDKIFDAYSI